MISKAIKKFSNIYRKQNLSYLSGTSNIPLLCEHTSERLRTITEKYPDNIWLISHH